MSVSKAECRDGEDLNVMIGDRFDFQSVQDFRKTYMDVDSHAKRIIIDMANTNYMDSSALGMLLNMRKHFGDEKTDISIVNCNSKIRKIFTISRFEKKFSIS